MLHRKIRYFVVGFLFAASFAGQGHSQAASGVGDESSAPFAPAEGNVILSKIMALVQRKGWPMKLVPMCTAFPLAHTNNDCEFQQVSFVDDRAGGVAHAANVATNTDVDRDVILFRLRPERGEFLIVAPDSRLIAGYYRQPGTDYISLPVSAAREVLAEEIKYWQSHLVEISEGLPDR